MDDPTDKDIVAPTEEDILAALSGGDAALLEILWAHASARRVGDDSTAHRHRGTLLAMLSIADQRAAKVQDQLRQATEARAVEVRALKRALRDTSISVWLRAGVLAIGSGANPCSEPYVAPDGRLYSHAGNSRVFLPCPCGWRFVAVFSDWAHTRVHTCLLPSPRPGEDARQEPASFWARVRRALRRWLLAWM